MFPKGVFYVLLSERKKKSIPGKDYIITLALHTDTNNNVSSCPFSPDVKHNDNMPI